MNKTAILWDLDGTLLDTLDDLTDGTNYVLRHYGLPQRSREEIRQFVGNGAGMLIRRALPGWEGEPSWQEALETFQKHYSQNCRNKTRPYEGILEVLEQLGREYPMAVVSNKPDTAVKPLCGQYFPGLYAQGETADCPRKPEPEMVFRAAKALGVAPEHCIYVGDSEVDIQTAKNAGMVCLSVLWGFRDEEYLRGQGGTSFCRNVWQLPEILRKMEKEIHGK